MTPFNEILIRAEEHRRMLAVTSLIERSKSDFAQIVKSNPEGYRDTITFLFSFSSTPTEISMIVGPAVLGIGAVIGLVYAFVRSYRRAKSPARKGSADE